jgi:ornithine racemase
MNAFMPRIEIALSQIEHNTRVLCEQYGRRGISLMGVSKAFLGEPDIALAMIKGGVRYIADSRIENIQRMREAGVSTRFVLLRTALSRAAAVVKYADISLNTELETIAALSHHAVLQRQVHQIIVMVEMGDLREGVLPENLSGVIKSALGLANIEIVGLGCNMACYGGIKPDDRKMDALSELVGAIEREFQIPLTIVSGGNSANHDWQESTQDVGRINNLRLGESILLGCETTARRAIPGMYHHAFKLVAEVIESKDKPSMPYGQACQDSFGNYPRFEDRGIRRRVIVALGKQDTLISGLTPEEDYLILGSSSDHTILDGGDRRLEIGAEVDFDLDYGGLLAAMTSPFIRKAFVPEIAQIPSIPLVPTIVTM